LGSKIFRREFTRSVFRVVNSKPFNARSTVFLRVDSWNDYSFVTTFELSYCDDKGDQHELGVVKIGFIGQKTEQRTASHLPAEFEKIPDEYFSLGNGDEYYQKILALGESLGKSILYSLNDVVVDETNFNRAEPENVFEISLMRTVSLASIKGQYKRIIDGGAILTEYKFNYKRRYNEIYSGIELDFSVIPHSKPSTNIHAIIGRNGAGKTTLLNDMIESIMRYDPNKNGAFYGVNSGSSDFNFTEDEQDKKINQEYFSSIVSVSFSAFDPFNPPSNQSDPTKGTCYYYVGLKINEKAHGVNEAQQTLENKNSGHLHEEIHKSLSNCFANPNKKKRWISAIHSLESDGNFSEMDLTSLSEIKDNFKLSSEKLFSRMSSGHAIVILTLTKLVEHVEEKTLVPSAL
jgi:hypothetical protein